jgi:hypothetical protein
VKSIGEAGRRRVAHGDLWPELAGKRIRPLLVTAFGDIFVETESDEVWVASPVELTCEGVASSPCIACSPRLLRRCPREPWP